MLLRVTGRVVRTDHRAGTKVNQSTGEARDWAFDTITVLVADQSIAEVTRFADSATPLPGVGDDVDYGCEVTSRAGRMNVTLDKPWADLIPQVPAKPRPVAVNG